MTEESKRLSERISRGEWEASATRRFVMAGAMRIDQRIAPDRHELHANMEAIEKLPHLLALAEGIALDGAADGDPDALREWAERVLS